MLQNVRNKTQDLDSLHHDITSRPCHIFRQCYFVSFSKIITLTLEVHNSSHNYIITIMCRSSAHAGRSHEFNTLKYACNIYFNVLRVEPRSAVYVLNSVHRFVFVLHIYACTLAVRFLRTQGGTPGSSDQFFNRRDVHRDRVLSGAPCNTRTPNYTDEHRTRRVRRTGEPYPYGENRNVTRHPALKPRFRGVI